MLSALRRLYVSIEQSFDSALVYFCVNLFSVGCVGFPVILCRLILCEYFVTWWMHSHNPFGILFSWEDRWRI